MSDASRAATIWEGRYMSVLKRLDALEKDVTAHLETSHQIGPYRPAAAGTGLPVVPPPPLSGKVAALVARWQREAAERKHTAPDTPEVAIAGTLHRCASELNRLLR